MGLIPRKVANKPAIAPGHKNLAKERTPTNMARSLGYKAAPTNIHKGYKTHGDFKNSGQKAGKHGANKSVKESVKNQDTNAYMKKVIKGLRADGTKLRRINMLPNTGAFH